MEVFKLIKQPQEVWQKWKPSRSLDKYETVEALWKVYNDGESVYLEDGTKDGKNPPLRQVEKQWGGLWRSVGNVSRFFTMVCIKSNLLINTGS